MENDIDKVDRAPAVVIRGPIDLVASGLRDQVLPASEVVSTDVSDLAATIASIESDTIVFLDPVDSLAPHALLCGSRALAACSAAAVVARAEKVDERGMPPQEEVPPVCQGQAGFLLGWARGTFFSTAQVFLRRDRVLDALHLPGVKCPDEVIAAVVIRQEISFIEDILVRSPVSVPSIALPESVVRAPLLEHLCFRLGGGPWADCAARAQVRTQLADALAEKPGYIGHREDAGHQAIVSELRQAAADLLSAEVPEAAVAAGSGRARCFAEIPAPSMPRLPSPAAVDWNGGAPPDPDPVLISSAREARAQNRVRVREAGLRVEAQRRRLAGLLDDTERSAAMRGAPSAAPVRPESLPAVAGRLPCVALEVPSLRRGGLEKVVAILARDLRSNGFRTLVICDEDGGALAEELTAEGIEVFVLGEQDPAGELAVLLWEHNVDVLSAHYSWLGIPAAAAQDIPVVMTVHNEYGWMGAAPQDLVRSLDPLIHGYVAVSRTVADFHAARFSIEPGRIAVVRNAVRPAIADRISSRQDTRARLGLDPEGLVLLLVGRIEPTKGQILLAEAVAECAGKGLACEVLLAGEIADPIYAAKLEQRLQDRSLLPQVRVLGARSDIPDLLAAADLFVQPSMFEGLSLAAVEALQAGVPAVLAPTGDARFLLGEESDARAGILFERAPNDPHETVAEVRFRETIHPAALDVQALSVAIMKAWQEIDVLRDGAIRRAEALREQLDAPRMVREHAGFLQQAIAEGAPANLAELKDRLDAEGAMLATAIEVEEKRIAYEASFIAKLRRRLPWLLPQGDGRESR